MNVTKHLAAALVIASIAAKGALAAPPPSVGPPLSPVGTLTIPAPFGSSPVVAWTWGASNSGLSGTIRANIQDLSVTRFADGQSPLLFKALVTGQHLPTVVLVDGGTTITLAEVLITSYSTGDSANANSTTPTENVTFNFAKFMYTVNGVTTCFNVSTNAVC